MLVAGGSDLGVVGYYNYRATFLLGAGQEFHHLAARRAVKVARRLVGQEEAGAVHQGSGEGSPLPLADGELRREPV